jgi:hypothetical protein
VTSFILVIDCVTDSLAGVWSTVIKGNSGVDWFPVSSLAPQYRLSHDPFTEDNSNKTMFIIML